MNETYADLNYADDYFEFRFNSPLWIECPPATKTKLLITASRMLEHLNWAGDKTSSDQELEFPRGGDTEIPAPIKKGVCEIAYALLDGRDVEYEQEIATYIKTGASGISADISPSAMDAARIHNIPSMLAWNYFRPFLRQGSEITLARSG